MLAFFKNCLQCIFLKYSITYGINVHKSIIELDGINVNFIKICFSSSFVFALVFYSFNNLKITLLLKLDGKNNSDGVKFAICVCKYLL